MNKLKLIYFIVLVVMLNGCSLPRTYYAESITATVVDEDTEKPLEGVNVVVYWQLYDDVPNPGGKITSGILEVQETVTDKNGQFHFPKWEPKTIVGDYLGTEAPEMIFFKPGYFYKRIGNNSESEFKENVRLREKTDNGTLFRSKWDKREVALRKGNINNRKFISNLKSTRIVINNIARKVNCGGRKIRNFIFSIDAYRKYLESKNIQNYIININNFDFDFNCKQSSL